MGEMRDEERDGPTSDEQHRIEVTEEAFPRLPLPEKEESRVTGNGTSCAQELSLEDMDEMPDASEATASVHDFNLAPASEARTMQDTTKEHEISDTTETSSTESPDKDDSDANQNNEVHLTPIAKAEVQSTPMARRHISAIPAPTAPRNPASTAAKFSPDAGLVKKRQYTSTSSDSTQDIEVTHAAKKIVVISDNVLSEDLSSVSSDSSQDMQSD
ncbi:uncharacterized protein LOC135399860 [Ornithodoros turicata]|uniref:uncharacterized protein LOC135399860 n=1 Tax=Ornithodoros turicata TaxID=34597 RepID=UPI0031389490